MNNRIGLADIWRSIGGFRIKCIKTMDLLAGSVLAMILPAKPRKDLPGDIREILIIRPGGIGDAVFLLPLLRALKEKNITVDILCEKRNASIFRSQEGLTRNIYLYDQWPDMSEALGSSYDIVIDTEQWHYLSAIAAYFIKSGYSIGFSTRPLRAKLFNAPTAFGGDVHELENFKRLFEGFLPATARIKNINDSFHVPLSLTTWAEAQIPSSSITIFLGASIVLRRFSLEQSLLIIRQVLSSGHDAVLLGGQDVAGSARDILKNIHDPRLHDFVGKISLTESAALIQKSRKFIGPDSGLMHLACAVGTPVIAVFGPGDLQKWGPRGGKDVVITENAACAPCTRFGYTIPTCGGSYHCVKNLKLEKLPLN